ncbi:DUF2849 domain-containing protein [Yunchengibacter salinarum]|uniref:DUF2849 domain-containing protein n=1 Tax=Yunchengibacter salinarum TaxID=3133399 RepID=UPI0035B66001
MAKKIKGPQMVMANRLTDGRAVFFTGQGWSPDYREAALAPDETAIQPILEAATAFEAANKVIDVLPIEAESTEPGAAPKHIQRRLQTLGPTVRRDLGYQAEGFDA